MLLSTGAQCLVEDNLRLKEEFGIQQNNLQTIGKKYKVTKYTTLFKTVTTLVYESLDIKPDTVPLLLSNISVVNMEVCIR